MCTDSLRPWVAGYQTDYSPDSEVLPVGFNRFEYVLSMMKANRKNDLSSRVNMIAKGKDQ